MIRFVRIEVLKMRTTPALWVTVAVIAGLCGLSGVTTILLAGHDTAPLGSAANVSHALAVGAATSVGMLIVLRLPVRGESAEPDRVDLLRGHLQYPAWTASHDPAALAIGHRGEHLAQSRYVGLQG